jgi:hypothetical protein
LVSIIHTFTSSHLHITPSHPHTCISHLHITPSHSHLHITPSHPHTFISHLHILTPSYLTFTSSPSSPLTIFSHHLFLFSSHQVIATALSTWGVELVSAMAPQMVHVFEDYTFVLFSSLFSYSFYHFVDFKMHIFVMLMITGLLFERWRECGLI